MPKEAPNIGHNLQYVEEYAHSLCKIPHLYMLQNITHLLQYN